MWPSKALQMCPAVVLLCAALPGADAVFWKFVCKISGDSEKSVNRNLSLFLQEWCILCIITMWRLGQNKFIIVEL